MNLLRWQIPNSSNGSTLGGLSTLRNEIDYLFGSPLAGLARTSQLLSGAAPALDIHEDKDNITVAVELPGMKREDIDVSLNDGSLSISGERKSEGKFEKAEVYRSERFFGRFQRTVTLPASVNNAAVKAQYKDGVLTITLPKAEEAKPKQIDVQIN